MTNDTETAKPKSTTEESSPSLSALLDGFLYLPKGWDGYDGTAPNIKTIEKVKEIAEQLPGYKWQAVPGGDGSVQIEHHADGFDIEINISAI